MMPKITKEQEGREGGNNQRELSTAGRWQTDTHFKHVCVSVCVCVCVCGGSCVHTLTFLTWQEGICNDPIQSVLIYSACTHL